MHNGQIAGFGSIKRRLEAQLPDALYDLRQGTTDSELFFLTLLAKGLNDDPLRAVNRAIQQIKEFQTGVGQPNRITCALSDGQAIYAFRYSSDGNSPSLYLGTDLDSGGSVLASEPLDATADRWRKIEEREFIKICDQTSSADLLAA